MAPEGEDAAWGAWFGSLGGALVDMGNRVGTARTLRAAGAAGSDGLVLTGYVLIEAAELDAAEAVAAGCPGLKSGVNVEVGEVVPT